MDDGRTTTRKGFLAKAGLTLAGIFTFGSASKSASQQSKKPAQEPASGPFARVRAAEGIVERKA